MCLIIGILFIVIYKIPYIILAYSKPPVATDSSRLLVFLTAMFSGVNCQLQIVFK